MRAPPSTVAVLSDHALLRRAVSALLREHGFQVTEDGTHAALGDKRCKIVILDLDHTAEDTFTLVRRIHAQHAGAYIVAMGSAMCLGASVDGAADAELETPRVDLAMLVACVKQEPPAASSELTRMHRQWAQVTQRQRDVLRWLALGLDNSAIAQKLRVGPRAVKAHLSALFAIFEIDSRTRLALIARAAGLRPASAR